MVSILSPGVYVVEQDSSTYPVTIGGSTVGIVGAATKGPVGKATLITSQENLVKTFGLPSSDLVGQGLIGALEILETTNSVYFVRVADGNEAPAVAKVQLGACPAVSVVSGTTGVTTSATIIVSGVDNNGNEIYPGGKTFIVASGSPTPQAALTKAFGGDVDALKVTAQYPVTVTNGIVSPGSVTTGDGGCLVLSYAGANARLYVSSNVALFKALDEDGAVAGSYLDTVTASGTTIANTVASYFVESVTDGAGFNLVALADGSFRGNSVEIKNLGGSLFTLTVNEDGAQYENYKLNLVSGINSPDTQIGQSTVATKSEIIFGNLRGATTTNISISNTSFSNQLTSLVAGADPTPRFVKPIEGRFDLSGGQNGAPATNNAAWVGDPSLKSGVYSLDDELLNLSVGIVPGINNAAVQNALITIAEQSTNFIALVSPPYAEGDTVQDAIDWSNGLSPNSRTSAINSSYAAIYWPWVTTFIPALGKDENLDPVIYGARQIAFTANVSELWFAPAGFVRGRLTKPTSVEVALNQGDRDALYSGGNVINPIVNFPQQGITIFGQRTAQRSPSALDRINVRLLTIYIKKVLLRSVTNELFEPNDPVLWNSIESTAKTLLEDIRLRRGITAYSVKCDSSTNTPARIERNELWCKVTIKPTKSAEAIVFELNLASQSASI